MPKSSGSSERGSEKKRTSGFRAQPPAVKGRPSVRGRRRSPPPLTRCCRSAVRGGNLREARAELGRRLDGPETAHPDAETVLDVQPGSGQPGQRMPQFPQSLRVRVQRGPSPSGADQRQLAQQTGPQLHRRVGEVVWRGVDLADPTGTSAPELVLSMWRVARLPGILRPESDAPEPGKAGFRAYDEALEEVLGRP